MGRYGQFRPRGLWQLRRPVRQEKPTTFIATPISAPFLSTVLVGRGSLKGQSTRRFSKACPQDPRRGVSVGLTADPCDR